MNNDEIFNFYVNEFNFQFIDVQGDKIIDLLYDHYQKNGQLRKQKEAPEAQNITNIINVNGNNNIVAQGVKANNVNINKNKK